MLQYWYSASLVITDTESVHCAVRTEYLVQFVLILVFEGLNMIS
jgi:hypothetical protein